MNFKLNLVHYLIFTSHQMHLTVNILLRNNNISIFKSHNFLKSIINYQVIRDNIEN